MTKIVNHLYIKTNHSDKIKPGYTGDFTHTNTKCMTKNECVTKLQISPGSLDSLENNKLVRIDQLNFATNVNLNVYSVDRIVPIRNSNGSGIETVLFVGNIKLEYNNKTYSGILPFTFTGEQTYTIDYNFLNAHPNLFSNHLLIDADYAYFNSTQGIKRYLYFFRPGYIHMRYDFDSKTLSYLVITNIQHNNDDILKIHFISSMESYFGILIISKPVDLLNAQQEENTTRIYYYKFDNIHSYPNHLTLSQTILNRSGFNKINNNNSPETDSLAPYKIDNLYSISGSTFWFIASHNYDGGDYQLFNFSLMSTHNKYNVLWYRETFYGAKVFTVGNGNYNFVDKFTEENEYIKDKLVNYGTCSGYEYYLFNDVTVNKFNSIPNYPFGSMIGDYCLVKVNAGVLDEIKSTIAGKQIFNFRIKYNSIIFILREPSLTGRPPIPYKYYLYYKNENTGFTKLIPLKPNNEFTNDFTLIDFDFTFVNNKFYIIVKYRLNGIYYNNKVFYFEDN